MIDFSRSAPTILHPALDRFEDFAVLVEGVRGRGHSVAVSTDGPDWYAASHDGYLFLHCTICDAWTWVRPDEHPWDWLRALAFACGGSHRGLYRCRACGWEFTLSDRSRQQPAETEECPRRRDQPPDGRAGHIADLIAVEIGVH